MAQPSYMQFCAVARALDVIGERWTLLVVRELLIGPQRYTDMLKGLGGVSPNVLAERLKKLEEAGVVSRRKLPAPAPSTVYELTPLGRGLAPVLAELTRWGLQFMNERRAGEAVRLEHVMLGIRLVADPAATVGVEESYEFHVEGLVFHVAVDDGSVSVAAGPADGPAAVFSTDLRTLFSIGAGRASVQQALAGRALEVQGDPQAAMRAGRMLAPGVGGAYGAMATDDPSLSDASPALTTS